MEYPRHVYDIETNGLLDQTTVIHCICIGDTQDGIIRRYHDSPQVAPRDGSIKDAVGIIKSSPLAAGHNTYGFDILAIQKVLGDPEAVLWENQVDTLELCRILWQDILSRPELLKKYGWRWVPRNKDKRTDYHKTLLKKPYSLEAWGFRLKEPKGDPGGDWGTFTAQMLDYCAQDVRVTMRLVETMWKEPGLNEQWVWEEMELKRILQYMKIHGWRFDTEAAAALYGRLNEEYTKVRQEAVDLVIPKVVVGRQPSYYQAEGPDGVYRVYDTKEDLMKDWRQLLLPGEKTKVSLQRRIIQGSPTIKYTHWNPTSRSQIIGFLQDKYQWMPTVWGKSQPKVREYDVRPSEFEEMRRKGLSPVVDEDVLGSLPYEECPTLSRLFMLQKRISQLYSGKQALMVHDHGGRIHASINANGTVTGRASHSNPNLSQVPASGKPFGEDFRALFLGEPGWVMVGGDASALELRELAAYLAFFDKGRYASLVTADGFDVHTDNAISMGFLPEDYQERLAKDEIKKGRSKAKPGYYGLVYGAGDTKLGKIVDGTAKDGARVRRMLYDGMPGIDKLLGKVQESAKRGYLRFPDGRHAFVRKPHSALNTLLQGVGGIIMKYAGVLLVRKLRENGLRVFGYDCPFWDRRQVLYDVAVLGWSHDEWQLTCRPKHADLVGQCIVDGIKEAGEHYNLRCPLDGAYDIGQSWADTH